MEKILVDNSSFNLSNKLRRVLWHISCWILFKPFVPEFFRIWRCKVLRFFGATIGNNSNIRSSAKIWAPWNLEVGNFSSIGPRTEIYNQGKIVIGDNTIISQKTYLCASSHDYSLPQFPLICKKIEIGNRVWIAADVFIGPGVKISEGAVIGARSAVFKNVDPWTIAGGNPAKFIKTRELVTGTPQTPVDMDFASKPA